MGKQYKGHMKMNKKTTVVNKTVHGYVKVF